jgi:serine/threonine-protein kinase
MKNRWGTQIRMERRKVLGDRYEVSGLLGRGGMAEVHAGWDHRLHRPVAIKTLHPALVDQTEIRERFQDEARSAAALSHPHIVAVYDCGECDGAPYIVMEQLPGDTLGDEVARGPLPRARVYAVLDDVLSALAAAHEAGIVHRDIKPANILFTGSGDSIKVADFGIAKSPSTAETATGQLVGTIAYLSPERLNRAPASAADDLYAVGVVGYEAVAGQRPFAPDDEVGPLVQAILNQAPPPLRTVRPDVDPRLATVIERALAPDPHWRFDTAEDMRAALLGRQQVRTGTGMARPALRHVAVPAAVASTPGPTTAPIDMPPATPRERRRRTALRGAAVIPLAFALAAFASLFDPSSAEPRTTPEPVTYGIPAALPTQAPAPVVVDAPALGVSPAPPVQTHPVIVQANDEAVRGADVPKADPPKGKKGNGPRKGGGGPRKP